jgi:hypothetical protein
MRWRAGDILVIEADAEALSNALGPLGLKLEESKKPGPEEEEEGEEAGKTSDAQAKEAPPEEEAQEKPAASDEIVLMEFTGQSGCIPLAQRKLRIPNPRKAAIAFAAGVLASMAFRTISPREVYAAVDWPVVVLLAALIPVAGVLESTGAGGFRFGDYWRLGLPREILVVAVGIPALLWAWPL